MISLGNSGSSPNQSYVFIQKRQNNSPSNKVISTPSSKETSYMHQTMTATPVKKENQHVEPTQLLSAIPTNRIEKAVSYLFQDGAIISDIYASFESTIQRPQLRENAERHKHLSFEEAYSTWRQSVIDETTQNLPKFLATALSVNKDSEIVSQLLIKAQISVQKTLPHLLDQGCKAMFEREFNPKS